MTQDYLGNGWKALKEGAAKFRQDAETTANTLRGEFEQGKGDISEKTKPVVEKIKKHKTVAAGVGGFLVAGPLGAATAAVLANKEGRKTAKDFANTAIDSGKSFVEGLTEEDKQDIPADGEIIDLEPEAPKGPKGPTA